MHNYIILIVLHNIGKIKQDILQLHEHSKYEYNDDSLHNVYKEMIFFPF